jgi:hypothetical protein
MKIQCISVLRTAGGDLAPFSAFQSILQINMLIEALLVMSLASSIQLAVRHSAKRNLFLLSNTIWN